MSLVGYNDKNKINIMRNLFDIQGRVIVITGGTGILGRSLSAYLAEQGARVVILGRNVQKGTDIVSMIRENNGEAMFLATDVLKKDVLEENLQTVLDRYSRVDALLNAAGGNLSGATIAPDGNVFDLKTEDFQKVLDLNLTGTVIPTQVFLRQMVKQQTGSIVNFSSMAAFRPLTRVAGYGVAKAGVSNFTAFMATEVAKKFGTGIRVNAIAPGFFLTEQNRTLLTNPDGSWTQRGRDIIRQTPMGRMGNPEELCGTIHYLVSDASKFVTGTVAVVDGGFNVFTI